MITIVNVFKVYKHTFLDKFAAKEKRQMLNHENASLADHSPMLKYKRIQSDIRTDKSF